jgi:hypothetical protein
MESDYHTLRTVTALTHYSIAAILFWIAASIASER